MYAYFAINGNNETAQLYAKKLTSQELAVSVQAYKTFEAANAALEPYRHKEPIGIIGLGYLRFRSKVAAAPVAEAVPQAEEN